MDAMTKNPVTMLPSATVKECAAKMHEFNIGSLIIQEGSSIQGIITEQDIVHRVVRHDKSAADVKAHEVMTRSITSISPDADIYEAMVKMRDVGVRHLPVTTEDELVGFLTLKDILKIEPDLFDMIVEHYELREEDQKPIFGTRLEPEDVDDMDEAFTEEEMDRGSMSAYEEVHAR